MCALRPNWAVGAGQSGEHVSRRGRGITTLHQFCFSGARSPEVALQHGCWVFVISLLEGGWHTVWWQCVVKLRQGGKAICFACNSDKCPTECCYYILWGWGKFLYKSSTVTQYSNWTNTKPRQHKHNKTKKTLILVTRDKQQVSEGNKCWALTVVGLTGSRPGIGHVHQRSSGLGQRLIVDCVGHCGGFLLICFPKVIVCQQHSGPVICERENVDTSRWQGRNERRKTEEEQLFQSLALMHLLNNENMV